MNSAMRRSNNNQTTLPTCFDERLTLLSIGTCGQLLIALNPITAIQQVPAASWGSFQVAPGEMVIECSQTWVLLNTAKPGLKGGRAVEVEGFQVPTHGSSDEGNTSIGVAEPVVDLHFVCLTSLVGSPGREVRLFGPIGANGDHAHSSSASL